MVEKIKPAKRDARRQETRENSAELHGDLQHPACDEYLDKLGR